MLTTGRRMESEGFQRWEYWGRIPHTAMSRQKRHTFHERATHVSERKVDRQKSALWDTEQQKKNQPAGIDWETKLKLHNIIIIIMMRKLLSYNYKKPTDLN